VYLKDLKFGIFKTYLITLKYFFMKKNSVNLWENVPERKKKIIEWIVVAIVFTGMYILGRFGPLG